MEMRRDAYRRAAEVQSAIRSTLLHDWDPIRLGHCLPTDEYDFCIAPIYRVLVGSRTHAELVGCLHTLESEILGTGSSGDPCVSEDVVLKLLAIDVSMSPSPDDA